MDITLRKVKTHPTMDGEALLCDVYLLDKLLGELRDNGDGGGSMMSYVNKAEEQRFSDYCDDMKMRHIAYSDGYDFYKSPTDITVGTCLDYMVDDAMNAAQREETLKKIVRSTKRALVYGTALNYRKYQWTNIKSLEELVALNGGLKSLQESYNAAIESLQKGEQLFNTKEQLIALGVKL